MSGTADIARAMGLLIDIGGDATDITCVVMPGEPWSKARPRHTRQGRAYQLPEDKAAERRTREMLNQRLLQPMTGNVAMAAIFYRSSRHRIDADNMLKHIGDAATGVAWHDDSQVTAILGVVELDSERPRTVAAFAAHESTMTRGTDWTKPCQKCGKAFIVNPKYTMRKYCGSACAGRDYSLAEHVPCAHCGQPFRRRTTAQTLCSEDCRYAARRDQLRGQAQPMSRCLVCDKELTHRRGGSCRDCWRAQIASAVLS